MKRKKKLPTHKKNLFRFSFYYFLYIIFFFLFGSFWMKKKTCLYLEDKDNWVWEKNNIFHWIYKIHKLCYDNHNHENYYCYYNGCSRWKKKKKKNKISSIIYIHKTHVILFCYYYYLNTNKDFVFVLNI